MRLKQLIIDTNIILDVLLERKPFFEQSKGVLNLCEKDRIRGFISASTVTDIFYIVRRALDSTAEAYKTLEHILNIVNVLTVTGDDVNKAFMQKAKDFEDCLLATYAKSNKCDGIVTRNAKDFSKFDITLYTPDEVLTMVK